MDDIEWAETAVICLNGHVVNAAMQMHDYLNSNFCPQCGEPAISECPKCQTPIPGQVRYFSPDADTLGPGKNFAEPTPYCGGCGKPFPWTERRAQAFLEMAQLELSAKAAQDVKDNLPDVMRDTPRTDVATRKIMRAIETMGQGSLNILKEKGPEFLTQGALIVVEHLLSNPR